MFKMILDLRIGTRYALTFLGLLTVMTTIIITWASNCRYLVWPLMKLSPQ